MEDNGCGFDAALPERRAGGSPGAKLGLAGMQERLALLGGELEIESSSGLGTTIFARLPLQTDAVRMRDEASYFSGTSTSWAS